MRCLGLIGGLGVGATIYYYQELVKAHLELGQVANLVILHADVNRVLQHAATGETSKMADYFLPLIRRLSAAGADIIAIPSATPHLCAPELMKGSPLPLVRLVDEIVREIDDRRLKRVALFGTRFTMETGLFGRLKKVDMVAPKPAEIDFIHQTYMELVNAGNGPEQQYRALHRLAHTLIERDGVEAIILAGTELSLVFNRDNTDFPHIYGARLHLEAIMEHLAANLPHSASAQPGIEDNRNDLCENLCSRWPFLRLESEHRNTSSWGCCRISRTAYR
jgi:aspartate racemase